MLPATATRLAGALDQLAGQRGDGGLAVGAGDGQHRRRVARGWAAPRHGGGSSASSSIGGAASPLRACCGFDAAAIFGGADSSDGVDGFVGLCRRHRAQVGQRLREQVELAAHRQAHGARRTTTTAPAPRRQARRAVDRAHRRAFDQRGDERPADEDRVRAVPRAARPVAAAPRACRPRVTRAPWRAHQRAIARPDAPRPRISTWRS